MAFNVHHVVDQQSALWRTLAAWPKIELHRHLEGSVRLTTLVEVARTHQIELPTYDVEALRPYVQVTDQDTSSAAAFLSKFQVLRRFYRSLDVIARIAYEAVEDAALDNVRYMELRFTPHALARQNGASYQEVIQTVCEAVEAAEHEHTIDVGLIISVNRHESVTVAQRVLNAALEVDCPKIVAVDLAGKEIGHSARPFRPLFRQAQEAGLHITVHAGEWDGPRNVREAVEVLNAERIGHGVRAIEDSTVVRLVRERKITLEVCPTSNMQSGVVPYLQNHPLPDLAYLNVRTTINTDDPALSGITLTDEMALAHVGLGMPLSTLKTCVMNAAFAAFLPDGERDQLIADFRSAMGLDDTVYRPPRL